MDYRQEPDGGPFHLDRRALLFRSSHLGVANNAGVQIAEYPLPIFENLPEGITAGPDNLWLAENSGNKIGRITTGGAVTEYPIPTASSHPEGTALGSDRRVWFTECNGNNIGALRPSAGLPNEGAGSR